MCSSLLNRLLRNNQELVDQFVDKSNGLLGNKVGSRLELEVSP